MRIYLTIIQDTANSYPTDELVIEILDETVAISTTDLTRVIKVDRDEFERVLQLLKKD